MFQQFGVHTKSGTPEVVVVHTKSLQSTITLIAEPVVVLFSGELANTGFTEMPTRILPWYLQTEKKIFSSFLQTEGCNMMTCTCGAKMCYVCQKPIKDYNHFGRPPTKYVLPQFLFGVWSESQWRDFLI